MKYLLYYKLDSNFIADQTSVGGDGTKVVSVVDGVAWANDQEKAYYRLANNDSENLTSYTVTVHYRTFSDVQLAPDDTFVVDAYIGKGVKKVVESKIIDGYKTTYETKTLNVYGDTEYTFRYRAIPNLEEPLTFNIISGGTIRWKAESSDNRKRIQYRINEGQWYSITSNTGSSVPGIVVNTGDVIQFRGDNAAYSDVSGRNNSFSGTTAKFEVEGNIMSLIDSENFATATTLVPPFTFSYLFDNCTNLTSAENLVLPAATLANYCYSRMFNGCTSLTLAPELPATTLADGCYSSMFYGCTSLTLAPELPATTLVRVCYSNMFQRCTGLTTAPELPATTLANGCYYYMFSNCTSLSIAPELPAIALMRECYCGMFVSCLNLTTAPELPATTLADSCYMSMFENCESLTMAPVLPATTLVNGCYTYMFSNCRSLTYIKCLAKTISYSAKPFSWVANIPSKGTFIKNPEMTGWTVGVDGIPTGWLAQDDRTGIILENIAIYDSQNSNIQTVGIEAYSNWTATTENDWINFNKVSGTNGNVSFNFSISSTIEPRTGIIKFVTDKNEVDLTIVQNNLRLTPLTFNIISAGTIVWKASAATNTLTIKYKKNNEEWISITSNTGDSAPSISVNAGDVLQFKGNNMTYCSGGSWFNTFSGSTAKFELEGNIMSLINNKNFAAFSILYSASTFRELFRMCSNLTTSEKLVLPATTLANYCYSKMFYGCTGLTTAPELPATALTDSCYNQMFKDCARLASAPALPATTLASSCYENMFDNCTSLTAAPVLPATTLTSYCYTGMFKGCRSLRTAPELPATTLAQYCYQNMFYYCTSLTTVPAILPATTLTPGCYSDMFCECTSLTTAPELPATTLASNCYDSMFYDCRNLRRAPELPATTLANSCYRDMFGFCLYLTAAPELPATILASNCYDNMFYRCQNLITAPALPATTLAANCYGGMFCGCINLTTAPELPATTLANSCYKEIFKDCENLNYIKCLATDISASICTSDWVNGVASAGTFVKNASMTSWTTGAAGIPANWTVEDNA